MRRLAFVLVTPMFACAANGSPGGDPSPDGGPVAEAPAFQITTPDVILQPDDDLTYCYYFRTPNTADLAIKQWTSHMTAGAEFMIVYLTSTSMQPPGSLSTDNCGIATVVGPVWTYAAMSPDAQMALPADDGEGNPVGLPMKPNQAGFIQMHLMNSTSAPIHAHVELSAFAYRDGVQATPAAPMIALNRQVNLGSGRPEQPTEGTVGGNCEIRPDNGRLPRFFHVTTHTYKQGVRTFVKDGAAMLFDSVSWANPGNTSWSAPGFYMFTSGMFTYQCEYKNPTNHSIMNGNLADRDEMCVAIGFYFPAADGTGHFCLNSAMLY